MNLKKNVSWFSMLQIFDEKIVSYVSLLARYEIASLYLKIIKFAGNYKPINQLYFFDYFEMIEILNSNIINKKNN